MCKLFKGKDCPIFGHATTFPSFLFFCKMQNSELHVSTLKDQYSFESRMRNKSELKISKGFLGFPLTMTPTILVSLSTYCYITSGTY